MKKPSSVLGMITSQPLLWLVEHLNNYNHEWMLEINGTFEAVHLKIKDGSDRFLVVDNNPPDSPKYIRHSKAPPFPACLNLADTGRRGYGIIGNNRLMTKEEFISGIDHNYLGYLGGY